MASYPVPDPTRPITDAQRGTVREAIAAGALPADLGIDAVARSADRHARSPRFWSAIEASAEAYATVATLAIEAGREPMLAAVPFLLTGYALDLQSRECANGPWQLAVTDSRVVVGPCRLRDSTDPWDRTSGPVPIDEAGCRLRGCEPDERLDYVGGEAFRYHPEREFR